MSLDKDKDKEHIVACLKRLKYKLPCFFFEMQIPHFIWNNGIFGLWVYALHDLLCPEEWLIRLRDWIE